MQETDFSIKTFRIKYINNRYYVLNLLGMMGNQCRRRIVSCTLRWGCSKMVYSEGKGVKCVHEL
ncbi:MAG: hypothetical protein H6Q73_4234 [Firmicutes bacterium]|nr:hypothetical protein [Bacillota bacterium]